MRNFISLAFVFVAVSFLTVQDGLAATVKAADVKAALDSVSIDFGSCTNASTPKTYKNDHIVNEDGKTTAVSPAWGTNFLQMDGQEANSKVEERSRRIKSAFSFEVVGARTITFSYRSATWGYNDDVLVFYEDDIDDTLFEDGAGFWEKVYTEDGEKYWDLEYTDFWIDGSIDLPPTSYFHTVNVALLAPYWDPEDDDWCNPKKDDWYNDYVVQYKAWLDDFVAEESDYIVCDFLPESGTSFGGKGLDIWLDTDYVDALGKPVLKYYYTLDGSLPGKSSKLYNPDKGIHIQDACTLRVAAYEGDQLVANNFKAEYTRRSAPEAPVCNASVPVLAEDGTVSVEITFSAKSEALALEYHYTLDGSLPTESSASGKVVSLNAPCALKVAAYDEGMAGPVSTYFLKNCDAPSLDCTADGFPTEDGIFDGAATVVFLAADSSHRLIVKEKDGAWKNYTGKITVKETTRWQAREVPTAEMKNLISGSSIFLASDIVSVELQHTEKCSGDWVDEQLVSQNGWNLVAVDRKVSAKHGRELAAWLHPYGFDAKRHAFELVQTVRPGYAYFVYGVPTQGKPAAFSSAGMAEKVESTSAWQLLATSAQFVFQNALYQENKTGKPNGPGWNKAD